MDNYAARNGATPGKNFQRRGEFKIKNSKLKTETGGRRFGERERRVRARRSVGGGLGPAGGRELLASVLSECSRRPGRDNLPGENRSSAGG